MVEGGIQRTLRVGVRKTLGPCGALGADVRPLSSMAFQRRVPRLATQAAPGDCAVLTFISLGGFLFLQTVTVVAIWDRTRQMFVVCAGEGASFVWSDCLEWR